MKQIWSLYILECSDGSLYTGITNNMEKRLAAHESGKGAKYTRGRAPLRIVYEEKFSDRSNASAREAEVKALSKQAKLELISTYSL